MTDDTRKEKRLEKIVESAIRVFSARGYRQTQMVHIARGELMKSPSLGKEASTLSRALTVVKVAKTHQDMRFDVPVVGLHTIETMKHAGATCLALDAGRCLMFDKPAVIAAANDAGICIMAEKQVSHIPGHSS